MPTVASVHLYPVKGMRGIDLAESVVGPRGLEGDRRWMLVGEDGRFISQRSHPRLCLFRTELRDGRLSLRAPDGAGMEVPTPEGGPLDVTVWEDTCRATHVSREVDAWLTGHLGLPVRLVYMPDETVRPCSRQYTQPGDHVGFADAFPVLVASTSSLDDLNSRLDQPLPMNRFRPNIVVAGVAPFEEDTWPGFELGGVRFRAAKRCGRCAVTTTDQDTAEVGVEPLRTLAGYRHEGRAVYFGNYFVPEGSGRLAVGQTLDVRQAG
ncbi:MAG: MOSC domain-containing protein [Fimbriimonadaceae bacterium]|nr:MOSC domain-containing protein [Fimbriimonadaceae bacterium]